MRAHRTSLLSSPPALALLVGAVALASAERGAFAQQAEKPGIATAGETQLTLHLSWGHQSAANTPFYIRLLTHELAIANTVRKGLEADDTFRGGAWQTRAGGGDVDGLELTLRFPERRVRPITNLHSIWGYLLANSDPDTARRLRLDPAYRPDPRTLTVQMNEDATKGFSVTADQLLTNKCFWVPSLDVLLSVGEAPLSFADCQKELAPWAGRRVLDQVQREPEASYEQFTARWEDMGSPAYNNPHSVAPGHTVCLAWDSSLYKFGIDRGANVRNDYGNLERFRFGCEVGAPSPGLAASWKGQKLSGGLPIITTRFERGSVRYEIEQFAFPLHGPPAERRGDMSMVLLQKVRLTEMDGRPQTVSLGLVHQRELPATGASLLVCTNGKVLLWEETGAHCLWLAVEGESFTLQSNLVQGGQWQTNHIVLGMSLPAGGTREFVVKLPSPLVARADREAFLALDYPAARQSTLEFWSNYLARGAQFTVPEDAVNELFRANLWHALRLPRRHGGPGRDVAIDLPYSNFAYDQSGTPWPVNQAVYVDYMLYDLRGYHSLSAEELALMFRNNQEANGHIKGFANWGVYTPSMIYAVARNYGLSGDRASLEALLPQTLKALDWCLGEMKTASGRPGPARGLVLAPLNDLSHDAKAWAFNQAYLFAGVEALGRALGEIRHPRAEECRAAAQAMFESVQRGFAQASVRSPLVQLRDQSWIPYVPGDALTPGRLLKVWYPTDVDSGPLHLSRLKALDPAGSLTSYLLNDHEDNLFLHGWGMANEPVYNQHATAYLLRDDPKAAIRAFYSMMACAFSHSVFEPVEHRWAWGQYFGPPSSDGAWFDLYRHILIHERDDDSLLLLQATPRKWLEDGKQIRVERAPTSYGSLSMTAESRAAAGEMRATIQMPSRQRPAALLVRFRHPQAQPIKAATVNRQNWTSFDPAKEWVQINHPAEKQYEIVVRY
jgi:hypothetical protein